MAFETGAYLCMVGPTAEVANASRPTHRASQPTPLSESAGCVGRLRRSCCLTFVSWISSVLSDSVFAPTYRGYPTYNYCWCLNSCTREVVFPVIYKALYIPGGAGCLPSTVLGAHLVISRRFLGYTVRHLGHAKLCHHRSSHTFHLRSGGSVNKNSPRCGIQQALVKAHKSEKKQKKPN